MKFSENILKLPLINGTFPIEHNLQLDSGTTWGAAVGVKILDPVEPDEEAVNVDEDIVLRNIVYWTMWEKYKEIHSKLYLAIIVSLNKLLVTRDLQKEGQPPTPFEFHSLWNIFYTYTLLVYLFVSN